MSKKIYLSPPNVGSIEKMHLDAAFESNWIAPVGPYLTKFEQKVCDYVGVKYACAVSSGTAALHLSLKSIGIKAGDKVLCPSLTFAASANAILYEKAVPIFIDVNYDDWVIDISLVEKAIAKFKPKALITVDLYGNSCNYEALSYLCEKNNVQLIEDSAEALGSEYKSLKLGSFGSLSILSFNGNKIITTSGGGMVLSNNEKLIQRSTHFANQSREPVIHYEHKDLGYNYRLSNLLAALGFGQMLQLDDFVYRRRAVFDRYYNSLSQKKGINFIKESKNCKSNRWLTTLIIEDNKAGVNRDEIINALEQNNIESRPVWKPMHLQPLYKNSYYVHKRGKDVSAQLFENGLCLPSSPHLSINDQNKIIDIISKLIR